MDGKGREAPVVRSGDLEGSLSVVDQAPDDAVGHAEDSSPRLGEQHEQQQHSFASAGLCSTLTFSWLDPLMKLGARRALVAEDLPALPSDDTAAMLRDRLARCWAVEERRSAGDRSFMRAILRFSGWEHAARSPIYVLGSGVRIANALLLGALIRHVQQAEAGIKDSEGSSGGGGDSGNEGYGYALGAGMVLCTLTYTLCHALYFFLAWREGLRLRVAVLGLLFQKALRLSLRGLHRVTLGGVANMASTDVEKFQMYGVHLNHLWMCPLEAIVCCALLWREMGASCLAGVACVTALMPLQGHIARYFTRYRRLTATAADLRVGAEGQMVHGARLMKMSGWERQFVGTIEGLRSGEAAHVFAANRLRAANMGVFFCAPAVICFVSFVARVHGSGLPLTSSMVFTALALFNIIQFAIPLVFQFAVRDTTEAIVAAKRIQDFLATEDVISGVAGVDVAADTAAGAGAGADAGTDAVEDATTFASDSYAAWSSFAPPSDAKRGLEVVQLSCSWADTDAAGDNACGAGDAQDAGGADMSERGTIDGADERASGARTLSDVTFHVDCGKLLVVTGHVGSSKSSLLLALAGELRPRPHATGARDGKGSTVREGGSIRVRGAVHMAQQQPFIMSGTVRENITFLEPDDAFDSARYDAVLRACALDQDLTSSSMPLGDRTIIGERGVNLSGGQKARIGLARVCYAAREGDVVLLDDPLSAVDPKVGRHIFERAIRGLLGDDGCNAGYAMHCTRVLVTHQLQYVAAADALLEMQHGRVRHFDPAHGATGKSFPPIDVDDQGHDHDGESTDLPVDTGGNAAVISAQADAAAARSEAAPSGELVQEEGREVGSVTRATYAAWFRAGGTKASWAVVVALLFAGQAAIIGCAAWIWHWAGLPPAEQSDLGILGWYGATVAVCVALSFARATTFFHRCTVASCKLHNAMLRAVARAPILFFDSQPVGRILNRLSKDINFTDEMLPWTCFDAVSIAVMCIGTIAVACTVVPWMLLLLLPLAWLLAKIRFFYLHTGREVKRLEAISRSPVFSMFSEALDGLETIRTCERGAAFGARFDAAVDANSRAYYVYLATHRWMGVRLDAVAASIVAGVAFLALASRSASSVDAGLVGLSMAFVIQIGPMFAWMIRQSGEVENQMTSVERVQEFVHTPPEAPLGTGLVRDADSRSTDAVADWFDNDASAPDVVEASDWPASGAIEFERAVCSYRKDLPPVLRGISFSIAHGEKVAIVGRTGAGKSSLIAALFRLVELNAGRILLDGRDVSTVGLHTLRTALSVIPQMPVLFRGSLRRNLDPFDRFSDAQLWAALAASEMEATVKKLHTDASSKNGARGAASAGKGGDGSERASGLMVEIGESGCNLSVGQRQLLCLARAMLPQNKVLVLDEATANVDQHTDSLIQAAVRRDFEHSTILMIAHRIETIIDADTMLVLRDGQVAETGSPLELMQQSEGAFTAMVRQTGARQAQRLFEMAERAAEKKQK